MATRRRRALMFVIFKKRGPVDPPVPPVDNSYLTEDGSELDTEAGTALILE